MTDNKATQIRIFYDQDLANVFMVDVEVIDVKLIYQSVTPTIIIMVIYKKWITEEEPSCSHESHFISSMSRCEKCGDDLDIDKLMAEEIRE